MDKKQISDKAWAYSLNNGEDEVVQELVMLIGAGRQALCIICAGPNPVYYHTEGNPPGKGDNDNGDIVVGGNSMFKITAAGPFGPKVYLSSKYGPTRVAVYFENVETFNVGTNVVKAIEVVKAAFP